MDPFISLMRRYCIRYVNAHDFGELPHIMADHYELRMGEHALRGRDTQYANAARIQMDDIPGMQLTVHEIATNGERLVMRFSEHGASKRQGGKQAVWAGIALYRWAYGRLTECRVEQDYHARRRQYVASAPDRVDAPAVAPWDTSADRANPEAEGIVRAWLEEGMSRQGEISFDDEWLGAPRQAVLAPRSVEVLDIFSAGGQVAFHARQAGPLAQGFVEQPKAGGDVFLHSAGLVTVRGGAVAAGRVVRDRMGLERRLLSNVVKVA